MTFDVPVSELWTTRGVDWRYQQACRLVNQGRLPLPGADRWMHELVLHLLRERQIDVPPWRVSPAAISIRLVLQLAGRDTRAKRHELETRLLTGEDPSETAARTGLTLEDVQAYEHLFFDVRARLKNQQFIQTAAIDPELSTGPGATRRRRFAMKLLAYHCGSAVLDRLYGILDAESRWEHPAELVQRLTATASLDRLADLVTSATTPAQLQATAQFILTQLAKIDLPTSPASELERDVLAFMDLAGGHGAPNFQMS